jgi:hypothetical protein
MPRQTLVPDLNRLEVLSLHVEHGTEYHDGTHVRRDRPVPAVAAGLGSQTAAPADTAASWRNHDDCDPVPAIALPRLQSVLH